MSIITEAADVAGVIIPSNPEDLKKIKKVLELISDEMTIIEGHRALIAAELKDLTETYELPAKFCRKMASTFHKQTFKQEIQEGEDFEVLYEAVVGGV